MDNFSIIKQTHINNKLYVYKKIIKIFENNPDYLIKPTTKITNIFNIILTSSNTLLILIFPYNNYNYSKITILENNKFFEFNNVISYTFDDLVTNIRNLELIYKKN